MKWPGWLRRTKRNTASEPSPAATAPRTFQHNTLDSRRFTAASTHRGNWSHWRFASADNINHALAADLPNLIQRCAFEYANNPLVFGAVETLTNDLVGRSGPRLQVVSDDSQFNEIVEEQWWRVWDMPDPAGVLTGTEGMRLWVRSLCTSGSFMNVFGRVTRRDSPVEFGWRVIDIRRKETPPQQAGDPYTAFGVAYTADGRPKKYYLRRREVTPNNPYLVRYDEFPAEVVQYRFEACEPEQLAGVPWLASCLDSVADLADYDNYELQAAKLQSQMSALMQASHPELLVDSIPNLNGGDTLQMQPGEITAIPAGWQAVFPTVAHPHREYANFRHERLRDLGIALGMPLMMILLSSAESNFASAHYDGAVYLRRLKARQAWLEQTTLNQLLEQIILELAIQGLVVRPQSYYFRWTWETPPYVNPEKQRKADRMAVEDGAMPLSEYCASIGLEFEEVVAARQREAEVLREAGLPLPPVNVGSAPQQPAGGEDGEDNANTTEASDAEPVAS